MTTSIININIGQCGINMGAEFWSQLCNEHNISQNGEISTKTEGNPHIFFRETVKGKFIPRSVFIDLDPGPIDKIRSEGMGKLFDPSDFIYKNTGSQNNWAQAKYIEAPEIKEQIMDDVRRQVESCDRLEGFHLMHSICGGTGSGLFEEVLGSLYENYCGQEFSSLTLFPSDSHSYCPAAVYNAAAAIHPLIEMMGFIFVMNNAGLAKVCENNFFPPTFQQMNKLAARYSASMLAARRFPCTPNFSLRKIRTNMIPFWRLHFIQTFSARVFCDSKSAILKTAQLTNCFLNPKNAYFDTSLYGTTLTAYGMYRGIFSESCIEEKMREITESSKSDFVTYMDNHFMYSICKKTAVPNESSCDFLINNTGIINTFTMLENDMRTMFNKKAFLHWFTKTGIENDYLDTKLQFIGEVKGEYQTYENQAERYYDDDEEMEIAES